ncbi:MAG TPA: mechanosensitive ion channel domain-containing protein [Nitrospiraceae bacterium]|nr:mechanosensitive ion channel domain-containing protein [Nitrospiraceae bacterium]
MESKGRSIGMVLGVYLAWSVAAAGLAAPSVTPDEPRDQELYFDVDSLNQIFEGGKPDSFATPRATLEHFILSSRDGDFKRAAQTFNFKHIPNEKRARSAPVLAEKFFYVFSEKLHINYNDVPDRPDGEVESKGDEDKPHAGRPRRSIKLGAIELDLWDVEVRLERFKAPDAPPIWLFSPRTVENIERLYAAHGPGAIMRYLPAPVRLGIMNHDSLWHWSILIFLGACAAGSGWAVENVVVGALRRWHSSPRAVALGEAASGPLAFLVAGIVFHVVTFSWLSLPGQITHNLYPIVGVLIVVAATWLAVRAVRMMTDVSSHAYLDKIQLEGECGARSRITRLAVVKHVLTFSVICIGLAFAFRQFNLFENISLSLLASAGVASVVLGVASRDVLGNIMAGIQIALTQPASIGDSIVFEGQWGWVEELTYTYITIRTWDARRIIVPLAYFIERPFENWSMKSAHTIQPIYLHVDYTIDVKAVRAKFQELVNECKDWDGPAEPVLEVTGVKEDTMELRALCSAKDPPSAWRMHCRLREELIAFLKELEGGRFLPKHRVAWQPEGEPQADGRRTLHAREADTASAGA